MIVLQLAINYIRPSFLSCPPQTAFSHVIRSLLLILQGNLTFGVDGDVTLIENRKLVSVIKELLSTGEENVEKALLYRTVSTGRDVIEKQHTAQEASYGRDALAKVLILLTVHLISTPTDVTGANQQPVVENGPLFIRSSVGMQVEKKLNLALRLMKVMFGRVHTR